MRASTTCARYLSSVDSHGVIQGWPPGAAPAGEDGQLERLRCLACNGERTGVLRDEALMSKPDSALVSSVAQEDAA